MNKKTVSIILFVLFSLVVFSNQLSLIEIPTIDSELLSIVSEEGYEITEIKENSTQLIIPFDEFSKFKEKYNAVFVFENADDIFSEYFNLNLETESVYHTYEQMEKVMDELVKNHSEFISKHTIGKSYEGREIWALKITAEYDEFSEHKPAVLFMGGHHAREWISVEVPIELAVYIAENYKSDKSITDYVNNYEIWIIPMVNPDGVVYSQNNYKYWRKTRRPVSNTAFGVDPNRNYGYHWGETGASSYPSSDTYKGEKPFSENCTQAVRDLAYEKKFVASISYHSYGELILYPYSYTNNVMAPDFEELKKVAEEMAKYNNYNPIVSAGLYPAAGDSDDWLYSEIGTFAFTYELAKSFIPNDYQVAEICEVNIKSAVSLLDQIDMILK
ncbi:MAG: M14 family metallopeptidase [Candidatus Muiribacteriota bacterium]